MKSIKPIFKALFITLMLIIFSGQLMAQEGVNTQSVKVKSMLDSDIDFVHSLAAQLSEDAVIIVYSGTNKDFLYNVRAGASKAKNEGCPIRGIIQGPKSEDWKDGDEYHMIYVDGVPVTKPGDASKDAEVTIYKLSKWAVKEYL